MKTTKTSLIAGLCALLAGCSSTYIAGQSPQATGAYWGSGYSLINNTDYTLDVLQDGRVIHQGLQPGQVLPLKALWLQRLSTVTVLARRPDGSYVGTDSYTFSSAVAETWTVSTVVPKGGRW